MQNAVQLKGTEMVINSNHRITNQEVNDRLVRIKDLMLAKHEKI